MEQVFVLALAGVTTGGAYLVGTKGLKLSGLAMQKAVGKMFESLGMVLIFLGINVGVGVIVILAARVLTRGFVSMYLAADATVLVLSLIQGLTFQWWRELSASRPRVSGPGS